VVREAILRELKRGGQVFYLHNRVQGIPGCAQRLKELVPEARLVVAHGQMPLHTLEKAMTEFTSGRADVLVCTSIIGAGLDLPNANTLIVERAELFGLADLYQLRGRVGRSSRQAYAYFFFSPHGAPTLDARRRLSAMLEFGELGSGFRLAVRDMEIRGAGNLLGPQQHGVMHAVGFDLYTRMLDSAVRGLKGEVVAVDAPAQISLGLETYLPEAYVADGRTKLEIYKRLGACGTMEEVAALMDELRDRFGDPPVPVRLLAAQAEIRIAGSGCGLGSVNRQAGILTLVFRERRGVQHVLRGGTAKGWRVDGLKVTLPAPAAPEDVVGFLKGLLRGTPPAASAAIPA
jgi:transcription-repair coupling factor (superfamily II helicase)